MKTASFFVYALLILLEPLGAQDAIIKITKLNFDNRKLIISYDIETHEGSNQFYVWLELGKKASGEIISAKSLTGDIGEKIPAGTGKIIEWIPNSDSVFIDEDVEIEIKAERYEKSFNKGGAILMSSLLPGLGQTKISGKPWWLTGIAAYGLFAGGFIMNKNANSDYNSYLDLKDDADARARMYEQAQNEMNLAGTLIISGAAIWTANLIWVASVPNRYKPIKHLTLARESIQNRPYTVLSYKINF